MTNTRRRLATLSIILASHGSLTLTGQAAPDPVYNTNDVLLFGLERSGAAWIDNVVAFSVGSTWDVFRRAATPGDPTYGTVIYLGNINTTLTSAFGTDWTGLTADTLYFGAAGQKGSLSSLSSAVEDGDYARTAYITSPRAGAGTVGQPNSTPRNIPTANSSGTVSAIQGVNSVADGQPNPLTLPVDTTIIDNNNPLTPGGTPGTAYTSINGGIIGAVSASTYNYGSASNVVVGLDLFRITPNTSGASAWQNVNSITADYGGTGGNGSAYFLGTITLSANGDVNFVAKGSGVNAYDAWASGFGLSGSDALGTSDPDKDLLPNSREFAFGSNPTVGSAALATTTRTGSQVTVTFLRRSDVTYAVQKRANLTSGTFVTDPGIVPTLVSPQGSVPPGYEKVSFTVPGTGAQFFQLLATTP